MHWVYMSSHVYPIFTYRRQAKLHQRVDCLSNALCANSPRLAPMILFRRRRRGIEDAKDDLSYLLGRRDKWRGNKIFGTFILFWRQHPNLLRRGWRVSKMSPLAPLWRKWAPRRYYSISVQTPPMESSQGLVKGVTLLQATQEHRGKWGIREAKDLSHKLF